MDVDLRISDMQTLLCVARSGSMSAAARTLGVTPSQISRAIVRLETYFGTPLINRGASGVPLTQAAQPVISEVESLLERLQGVRSHSGPRESLSIASTPHATHLLRQLAGHSQDRLLRLAEIPPVLAPSLAGQAVFEMILGVSGEVLGSDWVADAVGPLEYAAFARPGVVGDLGPNVSPEQLAGAPWIAIAALVHGRLLPVEDPCPVPLSRRRVASYVTSLDLAFSLAGQSNSLLFAPINAAEPYVRAGTLARVRTEGRPITTELICCFHAERFPARLRQAWLEILQSRRN